MRRRTVLALSIAAVAGCTGANNESGSPGETTTTTEQPTSTTTSTTTATTTAPCSTDIDVAASPEKPPSLASSAEQVVEAVESDVARDHFDPDGYFNFMLTEQYSEATDDGVKFRGRVEVDFSSSGDGENATTVHAHLFYEVTYRLTERRVVRASSEEGPTGTVSCW